MNNNKYITAKTSMAQLSRVHKHKMQGISYGDIIEWCAEVETDYLGDVEYMAKHQAVECKVDFKNKMALQPCNLYRTLDVCSDINMTNRIPYVDNGTYYFFDDTQTFAKNDHDEYVVYVNYYGIPTDDDGFPLIKKGHAQACYAFCVKKLYEEDFYMGKLQANVWGDILQELENQLAAAKNSFRHVSRNELEKYNAIISNMIPRLGEISTNLDINTLP